MQMYNKPHFRDSLNAMKTIHAELINMMRYPM